MPASETTYSSWVGVIYVFNLILGTGALTLPAVFAKTGWLLSTIILFLLGFTSYIAVTFIIECIACANATTQWKRIQSHKIDEESDDVMIESDTETNEHTAIIQSIRNRSKYYTLNETMPLGYMVNLYFNKWGVILFYASFCIYLYGDLTIYTAVVSKTLTTIICPVRNATEEDVQLELFIGDIYKEKCWQEALLTRNQVYIICVITFALLLCPFAYFNVQKTKYVQMFTSVMRCCAFSIMVIIAVVGISVDGPQGHPKTFEFASVSAVIGATVYSFMCHHSLPNIIAPFSNKQNVAFQLLIDYGLIYVFYVLLCLSGIFAFAVINDIYTLNFVPHSNKGIFMICVAYYLNLFPVFSISTSFPIIAITLQSNLKSQFIDETAIDSYSFVLRKLTFPSLAVIPPILLALSTHNLEILVKVTGAYAGVCVQFLIPATLVFAARRQCKIDLGSTCNLYASKFRGNFWVAFVLFWGVVCILVVTVNFFS